MNRCFRLMATLAALSSTSAMAAIGGGGTVPEPGSLSLVVLGVVGAVVAARFIRRK